MANYTVDSKGNVTVDGRTMSNSTFRRLYNYTSNFSGVPMRGEKGNATLKPGAKVKTITDPAYRTEKKPSTKKEVRAAKKSAKKQERSIRKITELSPRQEKKELKSTPAQKAAREASYKRAKAVAPENRTPAEKRAIRNFTARKSGFVYGTKPKVGRVERLSDKMSESAARSADAKARKQANRSSSGRGGRGGLRGASGLGGALGKFKK